MTIHLRHTPAILDDDKNRNDVDGEHVSVDHDLLTISDDRPPGAFWEKKYNRRTLVRTAGASAVVAAAGTVVFRKFMNQGTAPNAGATVVPPRIAAGTKPNGSNTGVPAGTVLTVYPGDMLVSTAGAVIQGLDIRGYVNIRASNVTIRNCVIRGPLVAPTSGSHAMVQQFNSANTNLLIEDCTLVAQSPNNWTVGVQGSNYTMRRCNISYVVDGADASGMGNILIDSCYIHDGAYFTPSATNSDGQTHSDGAQISNGHNIIYSNNTITGYNNSSFMVGQDQGAITGLQLVNNWLDGGNAMVNLSTKNYPTLMVVVTGNKFGRSRPGTYQILAYGTNTSRISGNVWEDNGLPVTVLGG